MPRRSCATATIHRPKSVGRASAAAALLARPSGPRCAGGRAEYVMIHLPIDRREVKPSQAITRGQCRPSRPPRPISATVPPSGRSEGGRLHLPRVWVSLSRRSTSLPTRPRRRRASPGSSARRELSARVKAIHRRRQRASKPLSGWPTGEETARRYTHQLQAVGSGLAVRNRRLPKKGETRVRVPAAAQAVGSSTGRAPSHSQGLYVLNACVSSPSVRPSGR